MFGYGRSKIKKKKNLSVYSRFRFLDSVCLKWVYLKQWPKVSVNTNTAYNPPPPPPSVAETCSSTEKASAALL